MKAAGLALTALSAAICAPFAAITFVSHAVWSTAHLVTLSAPPYDEALNDIPAAIMNGYLDAGLSCPEMPWHVLAAIGKFDHDHGRAGEFTFSPPVPEPEPDPRAEGYDPASPLLIVNDDGVTTPHEAAQISRRLAEWFCQDDATAEEGDQRPPLEEWLLMYRDDEEWAAQVIEVARTYAFLPEEDELPDGIVGTDDTTAVYGILVHTSIATQFRALMDHARRDGLTQLRGSGWRSHFRQHELRQINGCPDGWTHTVDENPANWSSASRCRTPTARPGSSNHESGLAIDFTYGGSTIKSRSSRAFRWLTANAAAYGFFNLPSEAWHWSVNGR